MKRHLFTLPVLLVAGILLSGPAHALRCGSQLVSKGDTLAEVKHICGEPTQIDKRQEPVTYGQVDKETGQFVEKTIETEITVVTFNFGPRRLMQELRFRDGKLLDVRGLGFGY